MSQKIKLRDLNSDQDPLGGVVNTGPVIPSAGPVGVEDPLLPQAGPLGVTDPKSSPVE